MRARRAGADATSCACRCIVAGEVDTKVVSRPGRYHPVTDTLQAKEVWVGDGERRRRYVVCYHPKEADRQRQHRAQVLEELEGELARLRESHDATHGKRVCALRASRRYGRYVCLIRTGRALLDARAVQAAERLDGKFVVHGNDDTLSTADMALGL